MAMTVGSSDDDEDEDEMNSAINTTPLVASMCMKRLTGTSH